MYHIIVKNEDEDVTVKFATNRFALYGLICKHLNENSSLSDIFYPDQNPDPGDTAGLAMISEGPHDARGQRRKLVGKLRGN